MLFTTRVQTKFRNAENQHLRQVAQFDKHLFMVIFLAIFTLLLCPSSNAQLTNIVQGKNARSYEELFEYYSYVNIYGNTKTRTTEPYPASKANDGICGDVNNYATTINVNVPRIWFDLTIDHTIQSVIIIERQNADPTIRQQSDGKVITGCRNGVSTTGKLSTGAFYTNSAYCSTITRTNTENNYAANMNLVARYLFIRLQTTGTLGLQEVFAFEKPYLSDSSFEVTIYPNYESGYTGNWMWSGVLTSIKDDDYGSSNFAMTTQPGSSSNAYVQLNILTQTVVDSVFVLGATLDNLDFGKGNNVYTIDSNGVQTKNCGLTTQTCQTVFCSSAAQYIKVESQNSGQKLALGGIVVYECIVAALIIEPLADVQYLEGEELEILFFPTFVTDCGNIPDFSTYTLEAYVKYGIEYSYVLDDVIRLDKVNNKLIINSQIGQADNRNYIIGIKAVSAAVSMEAEETFNFEFVQCRMQSGEILTNIPRTIYNEGAPNKTVSYKAVFQTDCGELDFFPHKNYSMRIDGQLVPELAGIFTFEEDVEFYIESEVGQATDKIYILDITADTEQDGLIVIGSFAFRFTTCFLGGYVPFILEDQSVLSIPDAGLSIQHDNFTFNYGQTPTYEAYQIVRKVRADLPEGMTYDPDERQFKITNSLPVGEYFIKIKVGAECNKTWEYYINWVFKRLKNPFAIDSNSAPFFFEGKLPNLSCNTGEAFFYELYQPVDVDGDRVYYRFDLGLAVTFIITDEDKGTLQINKGVTNSAQAGVYTIKVILEDIHGKQSDPYPFQLVLHEGINKENKKPDITDQYGESNQLNGFNRYQLTELDIVNSFYQKEPRPYFNHFGPTGVFEIKFSKEMNMKNFTDTLPIKIYQYKLDAKLTLELDEEGRSLQEALTLSGQSPKQEIFNYTIAEFQPDKGFSIQLSFSNPLNISASQEEFDFILVDLRPGLEYFVDKEGNEMLSTFQFIEKKIPRQMQNFEQAAQIESSGQAASSTSIAVFASNLLLSYLIGGALSQMLGVFESFVMMAHLTLVNVLIPANVSLFGQYICLIASFDIVPYMDELYEITFGPTEQNGISESFENLGYETKLVMNNLGSLYILILLNLIAFIIVIIIDRKCKKKAPNLNLWLRKKGCKWNFFVQFFLSNMFMIILSSTIGLRTLYLGMGTLDKGLNLSNFTVIFNFLASTAIIVYISVLLCKKYEVFELDTDDKNNGKKHFNVVTKEDKKVFKKLNQEQLLSEKRRFAREHGPLIGHIRGNEKKLAMSYIALKVARYAGFAIGVVFLIDSPYLQIGLIMLYTTFIIIFEGVFMPQESAQIMKQNIINECLIMLQLYHFVCYTEFVDEPETRYYVGYSNLIVIAGQCIYCILPLMILLFLKIGLKIKQRCCKPKAWSNLRMRNIRIKMEFIAKRKKQQAELKEKRKKEKLKLRYKSYRRFLWSQVQNDPVQIQQMIDFVNAPQAPRHTIITRQDQDELNFDLCKDYLNNFIHITGGVPKDFKLLSYNGEKSEYEHQVKYEYDGQGEEQQPDEIQQENSNEPENIHQESQVHLIENDDQFVQREDSSQLLDPNRSSLINVKQQVIYYPENHVKRLSEVEINEGLEHEIIMEEVKSRQLSRISETIEDADQMQQELYPTMMQDCDWWKEKDDGYGSDLEATVQDHQNSKGLSFIKEENLSEVAQVDLNQLEGERSARTDDCDGQETRQNVSVSENKSSLQDTPTLKVSPVPKLDFKIESHKNVYVYESDKYKQQSSRQEEEVVIQDQQPQLDIVQQSGMTQPELQEPIKKQEQQLTCDMMVKPQESDKVQKEKNYDQAPLQNQALSVYAQILEAEKAIESVQVPAPVSKIQEEKQNEKDQVVNNKVQTKQMDLQMNDQNMHKEAYEEVKERVKSPVQRLVKVSPIFQVKAIPINVFSSEKNVIDQQKQIEENKEKEEELLQEVAAREENEAMAKEQAQKKEEEERRAAAKAADDARVEAERKRQIDAFKKEEVQFDEIPDTEIKRYHQKSSFSLKGNIATRTIERKCTLFDGTTKVLTKKLTRQIII